MQVATDVEVLKFLADNAWSHGIQADGTNLYYSDLGANCFELKFPETASKISYFARIAAMMGINEEALFYGATLWITLSTIGSPQLEKSGWKMIERMRQGYGHNRSLQTASGHYFRADELVDLTAFLVPCFVYGWDAYVLHSASNDFFVYISHDEYWGVVARAQRRRTTGYSLNSKTSIRKNHLACAVVSADQLASRSVGRMS